MGELADPIDEAVSLHERAIALRESGAPREAEAVCREAVRLFEAHEGPTSANLANALVEHGRTFDLLDRFDDASSAYDRAIAILHPLVEAPPADLSADDHAELVRLAIIAQSARASVLRARGHLDIAETEARRTLALAETRLPADDLLIAEALNGLAVIHKFQGKLDAAVPLYERALAIARAVGAIDHQATLLHNLGGIAHARGDFAAGEPLARQSVTLRESLLGADHPSVAADRAAWGALLEGLGRTADAERAYAQALSVFESRLGGDSLEAASALTALGSTYHTLGVLEDAERAYRRSLSIREARLPAEHFDLGITLNNLGMLLVDRGRRTEARAVLERALAIFKRAFGADHPHTRATSENVAALANAPR